MKKSAKRGRPKKGEAADDLRPEYDFSDGVRGKYAERFAAESNFVVLPLDLAVEFPDSKAVEKALRAYLKSRSKRRTA